MLLITLLLSEFNEATIANNSYISDLLIRDLRSGQSRDLFHRKSMGKYSNASYFEKNISDHSNFLKIMSYEAILDDPGVCRYLLPNDPHKVT